MYHVVLSYVKQVQGWTIDKHGAIRLHVDGDVYCPLTYAFYMMTGRKLPIDQGWEAASFFGLGSEWLYACDFDDTLFKDERKRLVDAAKTS